MLAIFPLGTHGRLYFIGENEPSMRSLYAVSADNQRKSIRTYLVFERKR